MQGVVKIYDPVTGAGVVVRDDDRSEVFLKPGSFRGRSSDRFARVSASSSRSTSRADRPFAHSVRIGSDGY